MRNVRHALLATLLTGFVGMSPAMAGQIPVFGGVVRLSAAQVNDYTLSIQGNITSGVTLVWPNGVTGQWDITNSANAPVSIAYGTQATPLSIASGAEQLVYGNGTNLVVLNTSGGLPGGSAGGDLGGTYPSPTVTSVAHVNTGILNGANGGATTSSGSAIYADPVPGASAEYPFTEGSGTIAHDISGNNVTATLCSPAPVWTTYGLLYNGSLSANQNECVYTPLTTWKTFLAQACVAPLPQTSGTGTGGPFYPQYPSILSIMGGPLGLNVTNIPSLTHGYSGAFAPALYSFQSGAISTAAQSNSNPCFVIAVTLDTLDHIYINGVEQTYFSQTNSAGSRTSAGGYNFGGNSGGAFSGSINYGKFYSGILTPAQVAAESNYIQLQVASRQGFPTYPVYSTVYGPQLICGGDSLTAGYKGSAPWCSATYVLPQNTYTINNWGLASDEAHTEAALATIRWDMSVSQAGGRTIEHIWEGTNDFADGGWTAAQARSSLQQIVTHARSIGAIPVVATMISRNTFDTQKNALNALIRANWQTAGIAALDDLAAVPTLGADGANTNTACFNSDKTHLTGPGAGTCFQSLTGYGVVANQVSKIVNYLDYLPVAGNAVASSSNAYTAVTGTGQFTDNYVVQTPTATATYQLPDCTGLTGITRTIVNGSSSFAITVSSAGALSITGSTAVPGNAIATYTCELTAASTGGNYWLRTQ